MYPFLGCFGGGVGKGAPNADIVFIPQQRMTQDSKIGCLVLCQLTMIKYSINSMS